jgi:putative endonuclease
MGCGLLFARRESRFDGSPPTGTLAMVRSPTQLDGDLAEEQALRYLLDAGLRLIDRQVDCRLGEIDLIMVEGHRIVFVEVRRRRSRAFGGAAASVTPAKQRRIRLAAQSWLQQHYGNRWPECRFDVCAIEGDTIDWIAGAF